MDVSAEGDRHQLPVAVPVGVEVVGPRRRRDARRRVRGGRRSAMGGVTAGGEVQGDYQDQRQQDEQPQEPIALDPSRREPGRIGQARQWRVRGRLAFDRTTPQADGDQRILSGDSLAHVELKRDGLTIDLEVSDVHAVRHVGGVHGDLYRWATPKRGRGDNDPALREHRAGRGDALEIPGLDPAHRSRERPGNLLNRLQRRQAPAGVRSRSALLLDGSGKVEDVSAEPNQSRANCQVRCMPSRMASERPYVPETRWEPTSTA